MEIVQIAQTAQINNAASIQARTVSYRFDARHDLYSFADTTHRLVDSFLIDDFCAELGTSVTELPFYTLPSGWQSWAAGWELAPAQNYPEFRSWAIPALSSYLFCPQVPREKHEITASFMLCLRFVLPDGSNRYFVAISCARLTPPVQFALDYKRRSVMLSVYATGKVWQHDEMIAEIHYFTTDSFFKVKDALAVLFKANFSSLAFLYPEASPAVFPCSANARFSSGGWESWYSHYSEINERLILEDAAYLSRTENLIKRLYIDKGHPVVFQIDDGWQCAVGDWRVNGERFANGLAPVAQKIRSFGYIPGLWIAPFIVDGRTEFFREHFDWILKDKKGKPVHAGYNPPWGKKPYPVYYCLDLSLPEVLIYIEETLHTVIMDWEFNYIKLDFLFAGMLPGAFAHGGAAYEHYARALKGLTKIKTGSDGKPVAYLGCGMPFENSIRILPLCRIGADTRESWDRTDLNFLRFNARPSAHISLRDTLGHALWNQSLCIADPDVFFLRSRNTSLTEAQKESIALANYMFAGQIMLSDDPVIFDTVTDGLLTEKIAFLYEELAQEDFGNYLIDTDVYAVFSRSGTYAGIINLAAEPFLLAQAACLHNREFDGNLLVQTVVTARLFDKNGMKFIEPYSTALFKRNE